MITHINYTVPTNADYWTPDEDELTQEFIDRFVNEVYGKLQEWYPNAEIEVREVPETVSLNNKTTVHTDDLRDDHDSMARDIDEEIGNWVADLWPDWMEQTQ